MIRGFKGNKKRQLSGWRKVKQIFYCYLLTGVPCSTVLTGSFAAGFATTVPFIWRTTRLVLAFELTVTVLLMGPILLVL
jgi:hypothetical protein